MLELEQRRLHSEATEKTSLFRTTRVRSYVICGLVLFFAAILTGQHLYYPVMGAVCFFMAFLSYFTEHSRRVPQ